MKKQSKIASFCHCLGYIIVAMIIVICCAIYIPRLFGYEAYTVISGSMEPELSINSVVYVHSVEEDTLETGDIVTFYSNGSIVTHRVVSNDIENSEIVTKGDANAKEDLSPISYNDIIGKVSFDIPMLGYILTFLNEMVGKIVALVLLVVGIFLIDIK